jgi:hypothetical protein
LNKLTPKIIASDSDIFIKSEAGDKFLGRLEKEKSIEYLDIELITLLKKWYC